MPPFRFVAWIPIDETLNVYFGGTGAGLAGESRFIAYRSTSTVSCGLPIMIYLRVYATITCLVSRR